MEFKCDKCGHTQYTTCESVEEQISNEDYSRLSALYDYVYRSQADEQYWDNESYQHNWIIDRYIDEQETGIKNTVEDQIKHDRERREYEEKKRADAYQKLKQEQEEFRKWKAERGQ